MREKESTHGYNERKPLKRYDEGFKRSTVDMLLHSGKPLKQIARELDVTPWTLRDWKKRLAPRMVNCCTDTYRVGGRKPGFTSGVAARENAAGHFKKNVGYSLNTERQRFERVKDLSPEFSIIDLCSALQVSRSGYYQWKTGAVGPRGTANLDLVARIESLFEKHDENYGSPRITMELRRQGIQCNRKRIERLMRSEGMQALQKKRFKVMTTDSNHNYPIAPNSLPGKEITGPNQGWCTDITYIETEEGWLYLGWGAGSAQPQDRGLGHGRSFGDQPAFGGTEHGLYAKATRGRPAPSLRPRSAICQQRLSPGFAVLWYGSQHEPER